jgi:hypothetical protein
MKFFLLAQKKATQNGEEKTFPGGINVISFAKKCVFSRYQWKLKFFTLQQTGEFDFK